MIYQGTNATSGSWRAVVTATGSGTELGKISDMVNQMVEEINPFSQKLEDFSKKIALYILILCIIVVATLLIEGSNFSNSFLLAVSLAVSAIPEWLPAVVALWLAFATKRLVKRHVLVRKLPSSETLGRVTIICTDKTGTLTQSEMKVVDAYHECHWQSSLNVLETKNTISLLNVATLCNKATHHTGDNNSEETYYGDPTEIGLLQYASTYGYEKEDQEKSYPLEYEFPFDSERKCMSIVRKYEEQIISFVKWAPERILDIVISESTSNGIKTLNETRKKELKEIYQKLASDGKRVLAFWYKFCTNKEGKMTQKEAESDLIFSWFMAMIDPPRPEVHNAIKTCQKAGIRVIMITGDAELTAWAIAKEIGLWEHTIDATELSKLSDEELGKKLQFVDVFSRIAPQDKLRIVRILKSQWHIVAMTGDGVNDALALKQSDIGIAMGIRWTDVARDSADMVLINDNFASIVAGVEEGRRIYDNTKKFIKYLLACNFYEVFLLVACIIVFRDVNFVPFIAIHILWINLVTDSLPALALSSQTTECDVMQRKPINESLLHGIHWFILWSWIIWFFTVGAVFLYYASSNLILAQTLAVTTSVVYQMLRAVSCGRLRAFDLQINKWLILAILSSLALHFGLLASPLADEFSFIPLDQFEIQHFYWIFGLPVIGYFLAELSKMKKNQYF